MSMDGIEKETQAREELFSNTTAFIDRIKATDTLPEISLNPNSKLFVMIPAIDEAKNVERLFDTWNAQELPIGMTIEIVICINQKSDDADITVNNQQAYNLLMAKYSELGRPDIQFHIIDKFTEGNRFTEDANIGDIRNFIAATIAQGILDNARNGILLSSDADTFPEPECASELLKKATNERSYYGSIDKSTEYDEAIPPSERRKIKQLFLLSGVHEILLEYSSSGRLALPESFGVGGAGFFVSLDEFVRVGGYASMEFGEDSDILSRLYETDPDRYSSIDTPQMVSVARYSDRVKGDGYMLGQLKENDYKTELGIQTTLEHAHLREWLAHCLVGDLSYIEAISQLPGGETDVEVGHLATDAQKIEAVYLGLITKLYESHRADMEEVFTGYAQFIMDNFRNVEGFKEALQETKDDSSLKEAEAVVFSFVQFVTDMPE